jgi:hypothetical protein
MSVAGLAHGIGALNLQDATALNPINSREYDRGFVPVLSALLPNECPVQLAGLIQEYVGCGLLQAVGDTPVVDLTAHSALDSRAVIEFVQQAKQVRQLKLHAAVQAVIVTMMCEYPPATDRERVAQVLLAAAGAGVNQVTVEHSGYGRRITPLDRIDQRIAQVKGESAKSERAEWQRIRELFVQYGAVLGRDAGTVPMMRRRRG